MSYIWWQGKRKHSPQPFSSRSFSVNTRNKKLKRYREQTSPEETEKKPKENALGGNRNKTYQGP